MLRCTPEARPWLGYGLRNVIIQSANGIADRGFAMSSNSVEPDTEEALLESYRQAASCTNGRLRLAALLLRG